MGLADVFGKDDRTEIKTMDLYEMLKEGAKTELIMNAVNCNVPHRYIREMTTGKSEAREEVITVGHGYSDVLAGVYEHVNREETSEEESQ